MNRSGTRYSLGNLQIRFLLPLAIACLTAMPFVFHATHFIRSDLLETIEDTLYDARIRYDIRLRSLNENRVDPRVVVIDIDDPSIAREGQWPWPRDKVAKLVTNLFDVYGVRAVAFDITFSEPDRSNQGVAVLIDEMLVDGSLSPEMKHSLQIKRNEIDTDTHFAEALKDRPVSLGYIFITNLTQQEESRTGQLPSGLQVRKQSELVANPPLPSGYLANLPVLQDAAPTAGFFDNPLVDSDGIFRRMPLLQYYEGKLYESLSLAVLRLVEGWGEPELGTYDGAPPADVDYIQVGPNRIPVDNNLGALVPYRGPMGSFNYISASDVINEEASIDILFDSIVLVGTTAPGLFDLRSTPVGNVYAGVEVHANMISGLLDGRFWYEPDWVLTYELVVLLLTGITLAMLMPQLSPYAAAALLTVIMLFGIAINFIISFGGLVVLPIANSILYAFLLTSFLIGYSVILEQRKKRYLSRIFGNYVPKELVEQFEKTESEITLEGESRNMSVMFSDIRNFTSISEHLPPTELTRLMNDYLTPITKVIYDHNGNVDKYIGDAVMAFWGAPIEDPKHAQNAMDAAMRMQEVLVEIRKEFKAKGWPELRMGIGINAGPMNVGNMGSEFRTAYTVMGDTVNLASRLEGLCKVYDAEIVVGEEMVPQVKGYCFKELDRVRVKGKEDPITIYQPFAREYELTEHQKIELDQYRTALMLYRGQDWDMAKKAFAELVRTYPECGLYRLYLTRCGEFIEQNPPEDWDGVYRMKTK